MILLSAIYLLTFISSAFTSNISLSDELLDILIEKYGSRADSLSVEEFDNLLLSCNLGRIQKNGDGTKKKEKNPNEFVNSICSSNSTFKNPFTCNISHQCLSSSSIIEATSLLSLTRVNREALYQLCPVLLTQIEQGTCSFHKAEAAKENQSGKPSHIEVWGYGMLFVTLISLCSLVGVSVFPAMGKDLYSRLLTFLIGLAVGSLCGSALFHLLPQAFDLIDDEQGDNSSLWISLVAMGGIYTFFMTERLMKIFIDARKRKLQRLIRSCSDNETIRCMPSTISEEFRRSMGEMPSEFVRDKHSLVQKHAQYENIENRCSVQTHTKKGHTHSHDHHIEFKQGQTSAIATVAWMIIFGDGLHNFIDGLSIGAAFNESILTGISISVAVLCEEFPHELGDFAVLLNAGMSMKQALLYNFLSACTCYLGLIVGILLGELTAAGTYIFAFAGGMFLYISLVDMIPEMNEAVEVASKKSVKSGLCVLFLQNLGLIAGVVTLFVLAYYNKDINFEGH